MAVKILSERRTFGDKTKVLVMTPTYISIGLPCIADGGGVPLLSLASSGGSHLNAIKNALISFHAQGTGKES